MHIMEACNYNNNALIVDLPYSKGGSTVFFYLLFRSPVHSCVHVVEEVSLVTEVTQQTAAGKSWPTIHVQTLC